jgi:ABC-type multidrug transport system fused ATPase/permease subunit
MEKSRQVAHYKGLYVAAIVLALVIAGGAMFVDYSIIRGDIWTRALSNEFMVVPASLQSTVIFKSLQVVFAVLIVHFMLKITGVYGRNVLVTTAFIFALVMIGCLGYLVAYNNMQGGTSTTLEHQQSVDNGNNSIDQLFSKQTAADQQSTQPVLTNAAAEPQKPDGFSLGLPKLSDRSLANADSWFWLAFASVIFFIVTTVAALYLQSVENNVRNFQLARDYRHRARQFAQLHLLELADKRMGTSSEEITA